MLLDTPLREPSLRAICREQIAKVLVTYGIYAREQDVSLDQDLVLDNETRTLLLDETLPNPKSDRRLTHLLGIWKAKGFHRNDPTTHVELLIAHYITQPFYEVLGKRNGLKWVSPISKRR
jgi:hypothetical protein